MSIPRGHIAIGCSGARVPGEGQSNSTPHEFMHRTTRRDASKGLLSRLPNKSSDNLELRQSDPELTRARPARGAHADAFGK